MIKENLRERDQPLPKRVTLDAFQVMPKKSAEEFAALKESIRRDGQVTQPVVIDAQGNFIDGHHRYLAWQELIAEGESIERPRAIIRHDLYTDAQKRAVARELNASQRSLSRSERHKLVRHQLLDTPNWSNRRIAEGAGTTHGCVKKIRESMESRGEIEYHGYLEDAGGHMRKRSWGNAGRKDLEALAGYVDDIRYDPTADGEQETVYGATSQGDLALDKEQTQEAKRQRRLKNAYRKCLYALTQLTEATTEDAQEVASVVDEEEATWVAKVYGHTGAWLEWFVLNLEDRREEIGEEEEQEGEARAPRPLPGDARPQTRGV